MKSFNLKGKIRGAILALSLVLGIGMTGVTAQAQGRNDGQWQRRAVSQEQNRGWQRNGNRDRDGEQNRARRGDRDDRYNGYGNNGGYDRNRGYGNGSTYRRGNTGGGVGVILRSIFGRP